MNQRALWSAIGAVAAVQIALVLVTWGFVGPGPAVRESPASEVAQPPRSGGRLPIVVMLLVATIGAIPVGIGLVKLVQAAAPPAEPPVRELRSVQTLKQAQVAVAHWMREADLARAQSAGLREEIQRLRAEVARGASHLAQAAAESEQLLTERAHWLTERDHLSGELTERDRELERVRATLEERGSEADSVRGLLEGELADLREEVQQAHAALASHPAACRELLDREIRQHQHRAVAYIAHAIRGSLTSVLGFSRLLQRDDAAPLTEPQRASVQHIHEAGAHLLRIVNDLSELTQLEAGATESPDETVDVAGVVREVAASAVTALGREPGAIVIEAPEPLPPVRGSSRRLNQLLLALMQSPTRIPEGPVELSARTDDESISLVVTHHGASLPAQDLPAAFDPFAPIDATSTLQDDGRRLRLALARALAATLGGSIELDTGSGSALTFTVRVPVAADLPAVA